MQNAAAHLLRGDGEKVCVAEVLRTLHWLSVLFPIPIHTGCYQHEGFAAQDLICETPVSCIPQTEVYSGQHTSSVMPFRMGLEASLSTPTHTHTLLG